MVFKLGENHFSYVLATRVNLIIDHFNNYCLGSHNGAKAALLGSC